MREGGSRHLREILASELHFGGWMRYEQLEMTRQGAGMVKRRAEKHRVGGKRCSGRERVGSRKDKGRGKGNKLD